MLDVICFEAIEKYQALGEYYSQVSNIRRTLAGN